MFMSLQIIIFKSLHTKPIFCTSFSVDSEFCYLETLIENTHEE